MTDSPAAVRLVWEAFYEVDVRHALGSIDVSTTIVHRVGDRVAAIEGGRYLAEHIRGAKLVEVPGNAHAEMMCPEYIEAVAENVQARGQSGAVDGDRRLATVMFTDIVDSTPAAIRAGDRAWREMLDRHDTLTQTIFAQHEGRVVKSTGDGLVAVFDGPSRAVHCADEIHRAVQELGIVVRVGLHTGEIETRGDFVAGVGVHIAARIGDLAVASETLVSSTVKDLVFGSGFQFEDRGEVELKGIDEPWRCYAFTHAS